MKSSSTLGTGSNDCEHSKLMPRLEDETPRKNFPVHLVTKSVLIGWLEMI